MEKFLHAVNCAAKCDRRILNQLWLTFQDWRYVWEKASSRELARAAAGTAKLGGRGGRDPGENFAARLVGLRSSFDVEEEFARLWDNDIAVVSRGHREYPGTFFHLPDAPFLLYRKGAPLSMHTRMIAIVGTRRSTSYGEHIAYDLAEALAQQGVTVVSGLAFGIDAVAHFACVSTEKPTVAVLASGLFDITPTAHHRLSDKILEYGGTLVSEYPPNDPAYPVRFLERNRIIAGISEATVVVEAGEKSGALVTARLANDYNRDVYAVPGDITRDQSQGCLLLIEKGAHPFVSIETFLKDRGLSSLKRFMKLSPEETDISAVLRNSPCSTDDLIGKTLFSVQRMNTLLTELEIKGVVRRNRENLWELSAGSV